MELKPRAEQKIRALLEKGVQIHNPLTLDIGDEVDIDLISGSDVVLYPGTRLYGKQTVICRGAVLGREGTVTIDDCQVGPYVELKGGYFRKSVFLEKANMGLGAHVREGCILEEEAGGAHCVGLKQTILFPFVTLGSLINFCDCFMAGGTSRRDHSEVGSSYIHFNFTPDGNKTTPTLIGDVPRGVLLNQPAVFLGGQGGLVGPLQIGYGNIIAAGSIMRKDVTSENKLVISKTLPAATLNYTQQITAGIARIFGHNFTYMANLCALDAWYRNVRRCFFDKQEFGLLLYDGVLDKLQLALQERIKRLMAMVSKIPSGRHPACSCETKTIEECELHGGIERAGDQFARPIEEPVVVQLQNDFMERFSRHAAGYSAAYIETVQSMPDDLTMLCRAWLDAVVCCYTDRAAKLLPSFRLYKKK